MRYSNGFFIRFIRLAGPFWNSDNKAAIRRQTLAMIVLTVIQIGIAVVITEWSAALFNALEQHSMPRLLKQTALLILIFAATMAATATHLKIKRRLQVEWRGWLTDRVTSQWMDKAHHYQVTHIQSANHDNPDGRIAEDIRIATEDGIALCHSLFYSVLVLISFTAVLWTLSGKIIVDLGLIEVPIYGHLVWIAVIYAVVASFLGWRIGKPLINATDSRQTVEANFRFNLVTARENSLAIALIHGEADERKRFFRLFQDIIGAFNRQTHALSNIMLFTSGYSVLSMAFPVLVSAPRYILGSITLGALMQSVQSFQQMTSALSWPVDNMSTVAQWRASVERVLSLMKALDDLELELARTDPHRIVLEKGEDSVLRFQDLCIFRLDSVVCVSELNAEIKAGERVLIAGNAFTGSKLFKAIAGLWPWGSGHIVVPDDEPMFFMPPRPYLPTGTLRAAICYPSAGEPVSQTALVQALELAGLKELAEQLDQVDIWDKSLPREQQQRLGLARLLLQRPKWILLQEAFDSLTPDGETAMFQVICQELPGATLLTITNQPTVEKLHQRRITL
ncbi:ABC transporter [Candidatus Methylobacter favarea]|uniref:ABC transporter n=1 Tax=Candidatus Methylobacter favarea TaxID=2707345 RepID=A0A8S0Y9J6_9GAMM|nr:ABC transporter ATP-binding protein/permease [Candidatus Methylobacter favarea]CAA9890268.1 ABC transporter [Candidatus Methylobacter favarea]